MVSLRVPALRDTGVWMVGGAIIIINQLNKFYYRLSLWNHKVMDD